MCCQVPYPPSLLIQAASTPRTGKGFRNLKVVKRVKVTIIMCRVSYKLQLISQ